MIKKLIVTAACAVMAIPSIATVATFDWDAASIPSANWWETYGMTETDSGATLLSLGRAAASQGTEIGMKATYSADANPGVYQIEVGGVQQDFSVQSFDIAWCLIDQGGNPLVDGWHGMYGKKDGAIVWEIFPGVGETDAGLITYTAASTGNLGDSIDQIEWYTMYSADNSQLGWNNAVDNLTVDVVPEPATLGLMAIAGLAVYAKRKLS